MEQFIFNISEEEATKLGLTTKFSRRGIRKKYITEIFKVAKERSGKDILSIAEITAGFYELFTKSNDQPIRKVKQMTTYLALISGLPKNPRILTRIDRGKYKLYEQGDDEKYKAFLPKKRESHIGS